MSNQTEGQTPSHQNGQKRERISIKKSNNLLPAIDDPQEFKQNKCSPKARKICTGSQDFHYELWIDYHCHMRSQPGERDIEPKIVESLIKRAFKYLLLYSAFTKGFTFINHTKKQSGRILLQEEDQDGMLNVPIEVHYLDINNFEITVKTAMRTNEYVDPFKKEFGQYILELRDSISYLKKFDNGKVGDIDSL
jgi:hypothetical protein